MVVHYTGVNNSKLHSRFNLFSMIVNDKTPNKHIFIPRENPSKETGFVLVTLNDFPKCKPRKIIKRL